MNDISLLLTVPAAIIPTLVILWYIHFADYFPEPSRVVWTTFGLGVASILPVLAVELPVLIAIDAIEGPYLYGFAAAFLCAALPEEFFKFLIVRLYSCRHSAFDERMDGIVYGVAASLGFAALENVMYVVQGGWPVAIARAATAVPLHAVCGAIMGDYIAEARFPLRLPVRSPRRSYALALIVPVLFHGLYDVPLIALSRGSRTGEVPPSISMIAVVVLALGVFWAFRVHRELIRWQNFEASRERARSITEAPESSDRGSARD